jgi:outer membrane protein OmpA-like peptidoglycan-associated protein
MLLRLLFALLVYFAVASFAHAQQSYVWAGKVVKVSSQQATGKSPFSPDKVLGEPNAYPLGEVNAEAWSPKRENASEESIEVSFKKSLRPLQVAVVESANPGAVSKIELVDTKGERHAVYNNDAPGPLPVPFRVLSVTFPMTPYRVVGVVVTLKPDRVEGFNQIDAIGIAETKEAFVKRELVAAKGDVKFDSSLVNAGPTVNTRYTEIKPVISSDGKTLFFARQGHPENVGGAKDPQDVWYAKLQDPHRQTWSEARNLGRPINNEDPNGVASVSADGNTILLINTYNPDGTVSPEGASLASRTKTGWSTPVKLNILNYYNHSKKNVDYFLSNSGKILLMAVQRDNGAGDLDIYVSFLQKFGVWSKPLSLGKTINTGKADFAPFLAADEKTLYFASEGHKGYGKSDIFYSKRLDDTWQNWSKPMNLGPEVNTADWDAYYTLSAAGDHAYLVSNRQGTDKSRDIFRIALVPEFRPEPVILVTGRVLDARTKQPLQAKIIYESLVTGEELGVATTNPVDGTYTIVLPSGTSYGYLAEADGYIAISENIDATDIKEYTEERRDLYMVPMEVGQKIKLNNIFFAQSKFYLRESSFSELNRLVKIMNDYPNLEILVEGHTDNQGNPKLNLDLSVDRVSEVKKYLERKGIDARRISTHGWGDTKPVASNAQEESRRLNRRVEFTITKK